MNIGLFIPELCSSKGGAENSGAQLANAMIARGHRVTVFCFDGSSSQPSPMYPLSPEITLHILEMRLKNCSGLDLLNTKKLLVDCNLDVFTAFIYDDTMLFLTFLLHSTGIPLVYAIRGNPALGIDRWNFREYCACLAGADRLQVFFSCSLDALPEYFKARAHCIPNAVDLPPQAKLPTRDPVMERILLGAGRFKDQNKQFSILIKAFALLAPQFPHWGLTLCGDGPDRKKYERLIASLGLTGRVTLPGLVDNMEHYYAGSDLFCIPSRAEAFGRVVIEANSFALPVVAFAAAPGPGNIIVDQESGLLVDEMNAEGLAAKLSELMQNDALRWQYGRRARELCCRYDPENVYNLWEALFTEAYGCKNQTRLQKFHIQDQDDGKDAVQLNEILNRPGPHIRCDFSARSSLEKLSQERRLQLNALKAELDACRTRLLETTILPKTDKQLSFMQKFFYYIHNNIRKS